jgi:hypothetical protein
MSRNKPLESAAAIGGVVLAVMRSAASATTGALDMDIQREPGDEDSLQRTPATSVLNNASLLRPLPDPADANIKVIRRD